MNKERIKEFKKIIDSGIIAEKFLYFVRHCRDGVGYMEPGPYSNMYTLEDWVRHFEGLTGGSKYFYSVNELGVLFNYLKTYYEEHFGYIYDNQNKKLYYVKKTATNIKSWDNYLYENIFYLAYDVFVHP